MPCPVTPCGVVLLLLPTMLVIELCTVLVDRGAMAWKCRKGYYVSAFTFSTFNTKQNTHGG